MDDIPQLSSLILLNCHFISHAFILSPKILYDSDVGFCLWDQWGRLILAIDDPLNISKDLLVVFIVLLLPVLLHFFNRKLRYINFINPIFTFLPAYFSTIQTVLLFGF